eukprot:2069769-Alexandrium_andersonii.AAC.1
MTVVPEVSVDMSALGATTAAVVLAPAPAIVANGPSVHDFSMPPNDTPSDGADPETEATAHPVHRAP